MAAASLARKRAEEKIVRDREIFLKEEFNATCVARWEQRTSARIERQDLINKEKERSEFDAQKLQERQFEIRDLYAREELELRKELEKSNYVSIDDRMKAIRERATVLQEKRAKEKEALVKACYDRQWRDGCDDVRTLKAKAITDRLMFDRKNALDIKQCDPDDPKEDGKNQLIQELEKKEKEEGLERLRKNKETKIALDEQVRFNKFRKEKALRERQIEEAKQLETWTLENEMEKQKELYALRQARARGEDTLETNAQRLKNRERAESQKHKEEIIMLNYALRKEKNDMEREEEERQKNQGQAQEYRVFLQQQMVKDQQDTHQIENIRDRAMEDIWQRRDAEMEAKNTARDKLMLEVNASRDAQIREKNKVAEEMRRKEAAEVDRNIELWEKERQNELDKENKKKERTINNMRFNKSMMEEKIREADLEKQRKFLVQKEMTLAEQNYQKRVEEESRKEKSYLMRGRDEVSMII